MATSGVTSFTMTRDSMIAASLRLLRELGAGAVPTTDDLTNCNQALNMMLKAWQIQSVPLWTYQEIVIPLILESISILSGQPQRTWRRRGVPS